MLLESMECDDGLDDDGDSDDNDDEDDDDDDADDDDGEDDDDDGGCRPSTEKFNPSQTISCLFKSYSKNMFSLPPWATP